MSETTMNGAGPAVEVAAGREDRRAVGELGFRVGGCAAEAGVPDPELVERAARRKFTAKYKLEILEQADTCTKPGEIGELLRREGLYTSHLTYWRVSSAGRGRWPSSAGRGGASRLTGATGRSPS